MMNYKNNKLIKTLAILIFGAQLASCIDLSGGKMLAGKKEETPHTFGNKKAASTHAKKYNGEIHALRGGLGIFSLAMNKLQRVVSENYDVPGTSTMWYSAGDVSRTVIENRYKHHKVRPVILIGHSLGAIEQIQVANNLDKAGVPVDLLITIDAVLPYRVPANVKQVLNVYKPSFVPMFSGLRLTAVDPKVTNINNLNVNTIDGVSVHHFNIANNPKVQAIILAEVDKVLNNASRKES